MCYAIPGGMVPLLRLSTVGRPTFNYNDPLEVPSDGQKEEEARQKQAHTSAAAP
jgi:hypothetical protein